MPGLYWCLCNVEYSQSISAKDLQPVHGLEENDEVWLRTFGNFCLLHAIPLLSTPTFPSNLEWSNRRPPKHDKSTHPVYILVVSAIGMFLLLLWFNSQYKLKAF